MRMYEVEIFNGIHNDKYISGVDFYQSKYIVKESDLESLKEKGGGFSRLRYIGDLFVPESKNDDIIVNVSCNLTGKEDIEKTIEELQNKLNSLKVNLTI